MKKYSEGFWLVLIFNCAFILDAYKKGYWITSVIVGAMLLYMIKGYVCYLFKKV